VLLHQPGPPIKILLAVDLVVHSLPFTRHY
jgi:hypothetical protein